MTAKRRLSPTNNTHFSENGSAVLVYCLVSRSFEDFSSRLTNLHNLCFAPLCFPIPTCSLTEMSCLCFLKDACGSLITQLDVKRLIRLWAHPGSQRAPERKSLCSARRPVCLRCNYQVCSSATVDANTHTGDSPWRKQTKIHTSVQQRNLIPQVLLFGCCYFL